MKMWEPSACRKWTELQDGVGDCGEERGLEMKPRTVLQSGWSRGDPAKLARKSNHGKKNQNHREQPRCLFRLSE